MRADEYAQLRQLEDGWWWHQVLRWQVMRQLEAHLPEDAVVLDLGCGTGGMLAALKRLRPRWTTHGVDLSAEAVRFCEERGLERIQQGDAAALPHADGSFDAVLCLDALYHEAIGEERAMREIRRVLRPGGVAVINVPALHCLHGPHDKVVCGARRYTRGRELELLHFGNLQVETLHFWNAWLFLPLLLWRNWPVSPKALASDMRPLPRWLNWILMRGGLVDAWICARARPPFGSSLLAVATVR